MVLVTKTTMESVNRFPLSFMFVLMWFSLFLHAKSSGLERETYIVHMNKPHMPKAFSSPHNWYLSIIESISYANPGNLSKSLLLYTYDNALHGFSASLSLDELENLKRSPAVLAAYKDKTVLMLDTTHTPEFISPNVATSLWPISSFGKDVIIGVLDSGIWPESESFKDDHMATKVPTRWEGTCDGGQNFNSSLCNSKLIGVRYFNNGYMQAHPDIVVSMNSARDTNGHGTCVASIAAGNFVNDASFFGYAKGTAKGIAPHARLAIYKVFWNGESYVSDILAGTDKAIADGVDVICTSFGHDDLPLENNPIAIASFAAMKKGVLVSTSAGNEGPTLGTVHNAVPWVLTVTASSVDRSFVGSLILGNGLVIVGWTMFPSNGLLQHLPLVYDRTLSACNNLLLSETPHGIIICDAGSLRSQLYYITESNVSGAILVADNGELFETGGVACACLVIRSTDASFVLSYAKSDPLASATMTFQGTILGIKPSPVVASYASRGPSRRIPTILKPDIMAPGSLVLGAWPPALPSARMKSDVLYSDYNILYGTSIACAHATGVAALLKAVHPAWSPSAIKSAIMTTADLFDNTFDPIHWINGKELHSASPLDMGAGQIFPTQALDPGLIYDITAEEYVNFLCSTKLSTPQIWTIIGSDYSCSKGSLDLNYPSFIVFYPDAKTIVIKEFRRTVTNVGSGASIYKVTVREPANSEVEVSPMTLIFSNKYEKQSYMVIMSYEGHDDRRVSYGELVWAEENGKHTVRSPIVVSPMFNVKDTSICY